MPRKNAAKNNNNRKVKNNKKSTPSKAKRSRAKVGSKGHSRSNGVSVARKTNISGKPMSFHATRSSRHGNGLIVSGSDYVGEISADASQLTAGSKLLEIEVCPSQFTGTRLSQFTPLFERYKIRKWTFTYIPSVPSSQAGQLLMYPEYDPEDTASLIPIERIRQGTSHMGSVLFNAYSPASVSFVHPDPFTDLFTDGSGEDQRLTVAGLVRVILLTAIGSPVTFGTVHMDYEIEFYIPQLQTISQITSRADITVLRAPLTTLPGGKVAGQLSDISSPISVPTDSVIEATFVPSSANTGFQDGLTLAANAAQTIFMRAIPNTAQPTATPQQNAINGLSPYVSIFQTFSDALKAGGDWLDLGATSAQPLSSISLFTNKSVSNIVAGAALGALTNLQLIPISQYGKGLNRVG